jgi:hypothetical protein
MSLINKIDLRGVHKQNIAPVLVALCVTCSFLGAGREKEGASQTVDVSPVTTVAAIQDHGVEYTSEEAGIPINHEDQLQDLVYLKKIDLKDGKLYVTVDPVRFIDCRKAERLHQVVSKECNNHPEVGFSIENGDAKTYTYEMATSSGPFFLNRMDFGTKKAWRTMDVPTMRGLLDGTISRSSLGDEYYDAVLRDDPTNGIPGTLFYIMKKQGIIEKMIEKYRA